MRKLIFIIAVGFIIGRCDAFTSSPQQVIVVNSRLSINAIGSTGIHSSPSLRLQRQRSSSTVATKLSSSSSSLEVDDGKQTCTSTRTITRVVWLTGSEDLRIRNDHGGFRDAFLFDFENKEEEEHNSMVKVVPLIVLGPNIHLKCKSKISY